MNGTRRMTAIEHLKALLGAAPPFLNS